MKRNNHSRKTNENEIVEFRYENFLFMITRFKRINWKQYKGFSQYQYFLFIFDKKLERVNNENSLTDVFDTKVRDNVFLTFEDLKHRIDAILSEYILVDDAIFECLRQVEKLNPIYLEKDKE
ncbi:hypothetical protein [Oceanobacillus salinisoli]|uniref:hypothetical protein n=1 Tax=Oceanobacillus salinisoli TaxID=2678611 RepID=UPI0012E311F5|nr:hypothetical protein [Oceanobacillus salinisoli]